jgi:hypothetical protein
VDSVSVSYAYLTLAPDVSAPDGTLRTEWRELSRPAMAARRISSSPEREPFNICRRGSSVTRWSIAMRATKTKEKGRHRQLSMLQPRRATQIRPSPWQNGGFGSSIRKDVNVPVASIRARYRKRKPWVVRLGNDPAYQDISPVPTSYHRRGIAPTQP